MLEGGEMADGKKEEREARTEWGDLDRKRNRYGERRGRASG